jgi:hypothetical protein
VIEEEEKGVRILGQPHLRRGDVREQRHRHPIVAPRQRLAEHAQEAHRSLPAVAAGDVHRAHRRRAVLQDDEIDAGRADERGGRRRPRQREDHARAGENQAQPEDQAAEDRKVLAHRKPPVLAIAARVAAARRELPDPADEQHPGHDEQPQILRLREAHGFEIDA